MINRNFHKVAAVTLGSLLTFSSSTFASTSNVKAINHTMCLGNSEILVVQAKPPVKPDLTLAGRIALVQVAVDNVATTANSCAIDGPAKIAIAKSIYKAQVIIPVALAASNSSDRSDKKVTIESLALAVTNISDALALAISDAVSEPCKESLVNARQDLATALTILLS